MAEVRERAPPPGAPPAGAGSPARARRRPPVAGPRPPPELSWDGRPEGGGRPRRLWAAGQSCPGPGWGWRGDGRAGWRGALRASGTPGSSSCEWCRWSLGAASRAGPNFGGSGERPRVRVRGLALRCCGGDSGPRPSRALQRLGLGRTKLDHLVGGPRAGGAPGEGRPSSWPFTIRGSVPRGRGSGSPDGLSLPYRALPELGGGFIDGAPYIKCRTDGGKRTDRVRTPTLCRLKAPFLGDGSAFRKGWTGT